MMTSQVNIGNQQPSEGRNAVNRARAFEGSETSRRAKAVMRPRVPRTLSEGEDIVRHSEKSEGASKQRTQYRSTNVALANSAADRAGALLVPGEALGCALKYAPSFELQRAVSNGIRGWTGIASVGFAVAEKRDVCGVSIVTDA